MSARPVSDLTTSGPVGRRTTSVWQGSTRGNRNYQSKTNGGGSDSSASIAGSGRRRSDATCRNFYTGRGWIVEAKYKFAKFPTRQARNRAEIHRRETCFRKRIGG